jgi:2-polyprenyl-6-methoxyphenol hydroxylase-like FAD-dependent oxidoreductase
LKGKSTGEVSMSSSISKHRVVIVGSGFGGLAAVKALRRAPVEVTVIDRTNHHLFPAAALPDGDRGRGRG